MLAIKRPSYTTRHAEDAPTEQSERKRSQFENAVLKAYGIVSVHGCSSSSQGESAAVLKPSQIRWKGSHFTLTPMDEKVSYKSEENDAMNGKLMNNPFATGRPWKSARALDEVKTKKYEEDVMKAYGLYFDEEIC